MKVVINQSNYIPWKGYFDLIHDADLFIFLDDVQFTKNDWRNRNRIKGPQGLQWLTVPVGGNISRRVCDVSLPAGNWPRKHWGALAHNYERSPFFPLYAPYFQDLYQRLPSATLSGLNQTLIRHISTEFLGIKTQFITSEEVTGSGHGGQDRVMHLLRSVGATTYISGPAGKNYLDAARFAEAGISLVWKDYGGYPEYPQAHPPFEHALSIVDLLFSTGPQAAHHIWGWRDAGRPAGCPS